MNYYKITNEKEMHRRVQYATGLNVDIRPFDPTGSCKPGGLYFAREDILAFIDFGPWLRKVTLPDDARVYEEPGTIKKWKADKILLGERCRIDTDVIKRLISEGANIRANNDMLLRYACKHGMSDIVQICIENCANVSVEYGTPLRLAISHSHLDIAKMLIENGADVDSDHGHALFYACESGSYEIVKFLIEKGASVDMQNGRAVHVACSWGHTDVVRLLLEHGAKVGKGTFNSVITQERDDIVELLADHTDLTVNDTNLFMCSVTHNSLVMVKRFIDLGIDVSRDDNWAIKESAYKDFDDITELLLEHGADPKCIFDLHMKTPRIIKLLLKSGIKPSYAYVHSADRAGRFEAAELFKKAMKEEDEKCQKK
jgi:ankyrin repeat protein